MSLVSVLENPTYSFQYPEGFNIVETLVLKNLVAYDDSTTGTQSMTIGATSNVNIEAAENIQMYVKPAGSFDIYTSDSAGGTRTDTKILDVSATASNKTTVSTTDQILELRGGDSNHSTILSHTTLQTDINGSNQFMSIPVGEQFYMNNDVNIGKGLAVTDNMTVGRSLLVNDHIITYGNLFSSNINLWRQFDSNLPSNSNVGQVGYGFRVNTNHQLELVKYTQFATKTVAKRVALFGQAKFSEAMNNDPGVEFTSLNSILGVTTLPEMSGAYGATVDLSKPIQTYWATSPGGIFYTGGNVGISNNNPEFPLDVGGAARFTGILTDVAVIQQTATTSDSRLKEEITTISPSDCFDAINSLRVAKYTFRDDPSKKELVGFMAQEVENVFPNAISMHKFKNLEDCKMIDYNQIIASLVGAVQHLSDIVTDIQSSL